MSACELCGVDHERDDAVAEHAEEVARISAELTSERTKREEAEAALRCIGGLACYRDGADSYTTLGGRLQAIAMQVSAVLRRASGNGGGR